MKGLNRKWKEWMVRMSLDVGKEMEPECLFRYAINFIQVLDDIEGLCVFLIEWNSKALQ